MPKEASTGAQVKAVAFCDLILMGPAPLSHNLNGSRHNTPNDLAIDRKGRIWFTDPNGRIPIEQREWDHSSVLRLDPDAEAEGGWTLNLA